MDKGVSLYSINLDNEKANEQEKEKEKENKGKITKNKN